jgi:muramoyltetrapeptide carboxypeptidase LdcA involved in peptidoglycan recycling
MTWREAFRQQALSDYAVFRHLTGQVNIPVCHRLHYCHQRSQVCLPPNHEAARRFELRGNC